MLFTASTCRRLLWISLFAFAMAQLEAAVVVYLRELYYPDGFRFPLVLLDNRIALVEVGREAATLVMLVGVGVLSSSDPWRRFAAFLLTFGVWDIFYYVWLWIMLGWPESLLTVDILFLIPLPWVGPVLAPTLIAAVMILSALGIEELRDRQRAIRVERWEWAVVVSCAVALLVVFMLDAPGILEQQLPKPFPWLPFGAILALAVAVTARIYARAR